MSDNQKQVVDDSVEEEEQGAHQSGSEEEYQDGNPEFIKFIAQSIEDDSDEYDMSEDDSM